MTQFLVAVEWWTKNVALYKEARQPIEADNIWEALKIVREKWDKPDEHVWGVSVHQKIDYGAEKEG